MSGFKRRKRKEKENGKPGQKNIRQVSGQLIITAKTAGKKKLI